MWVVWIIIDIAVLALAWVIAKKHPSRWWIISGTAAVVAVYVFELTTGKLWETYGGGVHSVHSQVLPLVVGVVVAAFVLEWRRQPR